MALKVFFQQRILSRRLTDKRTYGRTDERSDGSASKASRVQVSLLLT